LSNSEHVTSLSKVIASSGLGNQLFQFCFAHNLVSNKNKVIFENNPIFAKNLKVYGYFRLFLALTRKLQSYLW
jgi:hypothetical protein